MAVELQKNQAETEEVLEAKEIKSTTHQCLWDRAKADRTGRLIVMTIRQTSNKPQGLRWKKSKAHYQSVKRDKEIDTSKIAQNQTKSTCFFEKISKIDKHLPKLTPQKENI